MAPAAALSSSSSSSSGPVNLLSMSAISECNSTKCLLHSDSEGPEPSPVKEAPPVSLAKMDAAAEHPSNPTTSSSLLRRKKSNPAITQTANGTSSSHCPSTGLPSSTIITSSSSQKKRSDREPPPEKLTQHESTSASTTTPTTVIPRPRPLSLRGRPHAWGLLKGRNKSYSLGHSSGEKSTQTVARGLALAGEMKVGRSLLDVDTEGQKRDCTVPLCRIQSGPSRPSVFELKKDFLS